MLLGIRLHPKPPTPYESDSATLISWHNLLQHCLILGKKLVHLDILLAIVTKNVFSLAYFSTAKPSLQNYSSSDS